MILSSYTHFPQLCKTCRLHPRRGVLQYKGKTPEKAITTSITLPHPGDRAGMHRNYKDCEEICDGNSEFENPNFFLVMNSNLSFQVCELIPTPKCQMTPCPVDATFVGMEVIIATPGGYFVVWEVSYV